MVTDAAFYEREYEKWLRIPMDCEEGGFLVPERFTHEVLGWKTLKDAAAVAGVSVSTMRRLAVSGKRRARKFDGVWLVAPLQRKIWEPRMERPF